MGSRNGYPRRVSYTRSRPRATGFPTIRIIILMAILIVGLALLLLASQALAASGELLLEAGLLVGLVTDSGILFETSGSAYIEPGSGLRINESGRNLITNPSFETGSEGWSGVGGAALSNSTEAWAGSASLLLESAAFADGVMVSSAEGGIDFIEGGNATTTFSIYLRSATGKPGDVWIAIEGDRSGVTTSGPFTVTGNWRRFTAVKQVASDEIVITARIYPAADNPAMAIHLDAAQLEKKSWLTPYFDGDQTGSAWNGAPHGSTSTRAPGSATIDGEQFALDFTEPWWFAIDVTLGFDHADRFGSYPVGTKDFLNLGTPVAGGIGMEGNEGVILDYYSVSKNLSFYKLNGRGAVRYPTPDFRTGDTMRVVCSWKPGGGMEMWVRIGENPVFHASDVSAAARSAADIAPGWLLSVSDSGCWSSYGDYQSNSLHRNLVVKQGTVDAAMALAYLDDPAGFLDGCGEKPSLSLRMEGAYWASLADYQSRLLSVDYELASQGAVPAVNVNIIGGSISNGVMLATLVPHGAGNVSAAAPAGVTLQYLVPHGVSQFRSGIYAQAADSCGFSFYFPSLPPNL